MCTETELCPEADPQLITSLDLITNNYDRHSITPEKKLVYVEMIKRGDANLDGTTKHARLLGLRWATPQFEKDYKKFLNAR